MPRSSISHCRERKSVQIHLCNANHYTVFLFYYALFMISHCKYFRFSWTEHRRKIIKKKKRSKQCSRIGAMCNGRRVKQSVNLQRNEINWWVFVFFILRYRLKYTIIDCHLCHRNSIELDGNGYGWMNMRPREQLNGGRLRLFNGNFFSFCLFSILIVEQNALLQFSRCAAERTHESAYVIYDGQRRIVFTHKTYTRISHRKVMYSI